MSQSKQILAQAVVSYSNNMLEYLPEKTSIFWPSKSAKNSFGEEIPSAIWYTRSSIKHERKSNQKSF